MICNIRIAIISELPPIRKVWSSTIALGQLGFQFTSRRAIPHFSFQSNCQQLQWLGVLHMQKPCGINRRDERKILLSRILFPFTLPFFDVFLYHICVTCANYRRKNQRPYDRYPSAGYRVQIQIPLEHSLTFAPSSSLLNFRPAVKSSSENSKNRSVRKWISIIEDTTVWKNFRKNLPAHVNSLAGEMRYFFACKLLLWFKLMIN